jgi:hypothetical protein
MNDAIAGTTIGLGFLAIVVGVLWLLLPFAVFAINSKVSAACADLRRIRSAVEKEGDNTLTQGDLGSES